MKTNIVRQDTTSTYDINRGGESWLFKHGHTIASGSGPAIDAHFNNNVEIILSGHATTTSGDAFGAIDSLGDDAMVIVARIGSIKAGHTGIALHGDDAEINNRGRVEGSVNGVYATGDEFHLSNKGVIKGGTTGVYMSGDESSLINHDIARIRGSVSMDGSAGETMWFDNYGRVTATNAVVGGASNDIIYNTGTLGGVVSLGAGNDVLNTRWGNLWVSHVIGGQGDDLLIVGKSSYLLTEAANGGNDTVRSNVSYTLSANVENLSLIGRGDRAGTGSDNDNRIIGSKGDNVLSGLDGDDVLVGRWGNDILTGGDGNDTFVFRSGDDMDAIADFTHGEDKIDLSGWSGIDSFGAVLVHAEDHAGDVWIRAGRDMLIIDGHSKADLQAGDFIF
jgi:Ca2+-binding RTX toxin-like protein